MVLLPQLRRRNRQSRRAAVTLELILVLPIFLLALMPVVQFGVLLSNEELVEMAARSGVQVASQAGPFSEINNAPVPAVVLNAVAVEMAKIGVTDYTVRMEHNIHFSPAPSIGPVVVLKSVVGSGPTTIPTLSTVTLSPNRTYVRVTVFVTTSKLTPNLLNSYGFDLSTRVSSETALRRYAA